MFHRYVLHNGKQIDYDRAAWLMDSKVFAEALASLPSALGQTEFDAHIAARMGMRLTKPTPQETLQALWSNYCAKHENKYGTPFDPDVM
jgi:hypothetical protein